METTRAAALSEEPAGTTTHRRVWWRGELDRLLATAAVALALTAVWVQLTLTPLSDTLLRVRVVAALLLLSYALAPWAQAAAVWPGRRLHRRHGSMD
jgi:hypothetical protein